VGQTLHHLPGESREGAAVAPPFYNYRKSIFITDYFTEKGNLLPWASLWQYNLYRADSNCLTG
jgi:hypothetical protein